MVAIESAQLSTFSQFTPTSHNDVSSLIHKSGIQFSLWLDLQPLQAPPGMLQTRKATNAPTSFMTIFPSGFKLRQR